MPRREGLQLKANDAITGGIFLAVAIFAFVHAGTFRALPGVPYGPDLFPRLVAVLMGIGGVALIVGSLRRAVRAPLLVIDDWARKPRTYAIIAGVVGSILFYLFATERLGFLLTGFLMLTGLLCVTRGASKIASNAIIGAAVTIVIYLIFVRMLRVPLPWGLIEAMLVR